MVQAQAYSLPQRKAFSRPSDVLLLFLLQAFLNLNSSKDQPSFGCGRSPLDETPWSNQRHVAVDGVEMMYLRSRDSLHARTVHGGRIMYAVRDLACFLAPTNTGTLLDQLRSRAPSLGGKGSVQSGWLERILVECVDCVRGYRAL